MFTAPLTTLQEFRRELHEFFRSLRKSTYLIQYGYPQILEDGKISSQPIPNSTLYDVQSDEDVMRMYKQAQEYKQKHSDILCRPTILLHVSKDPNAPPPPPPPAYLQNMPDPTTSESMTMLSFYSFPPGGIDDPEQFAELLKKEWKPFHVLGRVYVAHEGINAQMSVPTNVLDHFRECCRSIQELGENIENGINVDPVPLSMEEFATAGVPNKGIPQPPFSNLHVRVRRQVVADGLDKSLNWQSAGYDMPPLEWHQKLKEAKALRLQNGSISTSTAPVILDCRNNYETDIGTFEGAEPLGTENFRESWDVLKERLKDTPKDAPIMTFCTGGIRCVKVGAYLEQEMGFTNVSRLAGGIIAYDRSLNEQAQNEESLFKGTNFVFDGRLGRPITEDAFGTCITCGTETSMVSNCRNDNCHLRMVQCESCKTNYHGTCSEGCRQRVLNGHMVSKRNAEKSKTSNEKFSTLDDYSLRHSTSPPCLYKEIELNTETLIPTGSHMVSGASQGRLLKQLAGLTREGRILEIGTFTGYATACFLEGSVLVGASPDGVAQGSREGGPYVLSMERDIKCFEVASRHISAIALNGFSDDCAKYMQTLRVDPGIGKTPVSVDSPVKFQLKDGPLCELLKVTDALASLEEMAAGRGTVQPAPFDLVFVDADKTRLIEYTEACLSSDRILKPGGLIIVDNVLWKGLVLEAGNGEFTSIGDTSEEDELQLQRNRRARKLASKMHRFNSEIVKDDRAEVVVLPIRDGLSIIRKK